jgi:hypothetical protein
MGDLEGRDRARAVENWAPFWGGDWVVVYIIYIGLIAADIVEAGISCVDV